MKKLLTSVFIFTTFLSISFVNVQLVRASNCPANFQEDPKGDCYCPANGQTYNSILADSITCGVGNGNNTTGAGTNDSTADTGDSTDSTAGTGDPKIPTGPQKLVNPLSNIGSICELISALLNIVTEIGAIIAVMFIIWSGFLFIKAQGNPEEIKKAKQAFYYTILGTAILLGSSVLAKIIITTIGAITKNSGNSIC